MEDNDHYYLDNNDLEENSPSFFKSATFKLGILFAGSFAFSSARRPLGNLARKYKNLYDVSSLKPSLNSKFDELNKNSEFFRESTNFIKKSYENISKIIPEPANDFSLKSKLASAIKPLNKRDYFWSDITGEINRHSLHKNKDEEYIKFFDVFQKRFKNIKSNKEKEFIFNDFQNKFSKESTGFFKNGYKEFIKSKPENIVNKFKDSNIKKEYIQKFVKSKNDIQDLKEVLSPVNNAFELYLESQLTNNDVGFEDLFINVGIGLGINKTFSTIGKSSLNYKSVIEKSSKISFGEIKKPFIKKGDVIELKKEPSLLTSGLEKFNELIDRKHKIDNVSKFNIIKETIGDFKLSKFDNKELGLSKLYNQVNKDVGVFHGPYDFLNFSRNRYDKNKIYNKYLISNALTNINFIGGVKKSTDFFNRNRKLHGVRGSFKTSITETAINSTKDIENLLINSKNKYILSENKEKINLNKYDDFDITSEARRLNNNIKAQRYKDDIIYEFDEKLDVRKKQIEDKNYLIYNTNRNNEDLEIYIELQERFNNHRQYFSESSTTSSDFIKASDSYNRGISIGVKNNASFLNSASSDNKKLYHYRDTIKDASSLAYEDNVSDYSSELFKEAIIYATEANNNSLRTVISNSKKADYIEGLNALRRRKDLEIDEYSKRDIDIVGKLKLETKNVAGVIKKSVGLTNEDFIEIREFLKKNIEESNFSSKKTKDSFENLHNFLSTTTLKDLNLGLEKDEGISKVNEFLTTFFEELLDVNKKPIDEIIEDYIDIKKPLKEQSFIFPIISKYAIKDLRSPIQPKDQHLIEDVKLLDKNLTEIISKFRSDINNKSNKIDINDKVQKSKANKISKQIEDDDLFIKNLVKEIETEFDIPIFNPQIINPENPFSNFSSGAFGERRLDLISYGIKSAVQNLQTHFINTVNDISSNLITVLSSPITILEKYGIFKEVLKTKKIKSYVDATKDVLKIEQMDDSLLGASNFKYISSFVYKYSKLSAFALGGYTVADDLLRTSTETLFGEEDKFGLKETIGNSLKISLLASHKVADVIGIKSLAQYAEDIAPSSITSAFPLVFATLVSYSTLGPGALGKVLKNSVSNLSALKFVLNKNRVFKESSARFIKNKFGLKQDLKDIENKLGLPIFMTQFLGGFGLLSTVGFYDAEKETDDVLLELQGYKDVIAYKTRFWETNRTNFVGEQKSYYRKSFLYNLSNPAEGYNEVHDYFNKPYLKSSLVDNGFFSSFLSPLIPSINNYENIEQYLKSPYSGIAVSSYEKDIISGGYYREFQETPFEQLDIYNREINKSRDFNKIFSLTGKVEDVYGAYGWLFSLGQNVHGVGYGDDSYRIAKAGEKDFTRTFLDENIGNLFGGGEFARRIIGKQSQAGLINPIRNLSPSYYPLELQYGDIENKLKSGEHRIGGINYQRINDVNYSLPLDVEIFGKTEKEIYEYYYGVNYPVTDEEKAERYGRLNALSYISTVADNLRNSKRDISVFDKFDNISGQGDLSYINDDNEKVLGISINRIKEQLDLRDKDVVKLNALLNIGGFDKGEIYYTDNDGNTRNYKIDKDYGSYLEELDRVRDIRDDVKAHILGNPNINKFDLSNAYSRLDRYKIVSNLAPYSLKNRILKKQNQALLDNYITSEKNKFFSINKSVEDLKDKEYFKKRFGDYLTPETSLKYNKFERFLGRSWENFSTLDTFLNDVIIGNKTLLDTYAQNVSHGSPFPQWTSPINSYLINNVNQIRAGENPVEGFLPLYLPLTVLSPFIALPNLATYAGIAGATYSTFFGDENFTSSDAKKVREINKEVDQAKYIINRGLYEKTGGDYYKKEYEDTLVNDVLSGTNNNDYFSVYPTERKYFRDIKKLENQSDQTRAIRLLGEEYKSILANVFYNSRIDNSQVEIDVDDDLIKDYQENYDLKNIYFQKYEDYGADISKSNIYF